ncbi:gamma-glutamylcyclotransferase [soil metagenome]
MTDRLFVYGTLMRNSYHALARELKQRADYEGPARFNGRLYRVTHYPGVVASSAPEDWVFGDVYTLRDRDLLTELDRYEGCGPDDPPPTQYLRLLQSVMLPSGPAVEAWIYIYNRPIDRLQRIVSGRFSDADAL